MVGAYALSSQTSPFRSPLRLQWRGRRSIWGVQQPRITYRGAGAQAIHILTNRRAQYQCTAHASVLIAYWQYT